MGSRFPRFEEKVALNGEEIPRPKGWTQRMYQVSEGPFRFEKETFEICDGLFIETHPNPSVAKSDGANMLPLNQFEALMQKLIRVRESIL